MYFEVYPDIIFILNFILDFILLYLLKKINRKEGTFIRRIAAAAVGAAVAALAGLFPWMNVILRVIIMNIAAAVFMVRIAFGKMGKGELVKQVIVLYLITYAVGGLINTVYYNTGIKVQLVRFGEFFLYSGISWGFIAVAFTAVSLLALAVIWFYRCYAGSRMEVYDVELFLMDNHIKTKGLLDTGNGLFDPVTGKAVIIMEASLLEVLLTEGMRTQFDRTKAMLEGRTVGVNPVRKDSVETNPVGTDSVEANPVGIDSVEADSDGIGAEGGGEEFLPLKWIPFRSIGREKGMMAGLVLDKLVIYTGQSSSSINKVIAAVCDNQLSAQKEYQVILHKDMIPNNR